MSKSKAEQSVQAVKDLARKTSNKTCFDCGRPGPHGNVNLSVNSFVCTTCAGLHRKFNHKIKTINMSTFPQSEVDALEAGGNKRARKYWLGRWSEDQYKVDPEDVKSIDRFMTLVYVDKKWVQDDRNADKGEKEKEKKKEKKETKSSPSASDPKSSSLSSSNSFSESSNGSNGKEKLDKVKSPKPGKTHKEKSGPSGDKAGSGSSASAASSSAKKDAIDFLTQLSDLTFESPSSASSPFPSQPSSSDNHNNGFDTDFTSSSSSSASSSVPANRAVLSRKGSVNGNAFASIAASAAASVPVPAAALTFITTQLRSAQSIYSLSTEQLQSAVMQALNKLNEEAINGAPFKKGDLDHFADLDAGGGPGSAGGEDQGEADTGNPFDSDEDEDESVQNQYQQQMRAMQQQQQQPQYVHAAAANAPFGGAPTPFVGVAPGASPFGPPGGFGSIQPQTQQPGFYNHPSYAAGPAQFHVTSAAPPPAQPAQQSKPDLFGEFSTLGF